MNNSNGSPRLDGLAQLAGGYRGVLCDVWGVVHDGVAPMAGTVDALTRFRADFGPVVLLTNAPRSKELVIDQLDRLGVARDAYDAVVTSGDAAKAHVATLTGPIFHIGTQADHSMYDGLDVELADWREANAVVCTGLFDDFTETPEDYGELLANLKSRDLPFVCANPDLIVHHGGLMRWCAGALARDYRALGGTTVVFGKPHRPIYQHALSRLFEVAGEELDHGDVLAIGDGIATDVAGAQRFGLDVVYISAGIHADEFGPANAPDHAKVSAFLASHDARPVGYMPHLGW